MRRRKGIVAIGLSLIMLGTSFSTSVLAVNTNVKQNESTNLINDGITFEEKISTSLIKDEGEYRQKSGEWGDENKEHKFTTDIERLKYKKGQSINIKLDNNDSDIKYRYELDNVELVKANGQSDDTYMYVIDPRSSSELVSGNNFNDDSGTGLNPLITTNLTAGVQYLIIYSMYNPNSLTGEVGFGLVINKN